MASQQAQICDVLGSLLVAQWQMSMLSVLSYVNSPSPCDLVTVLLFMDGYIQTDPDIACRTTQERQHSVRHSMLTNILLHPLSASAGDISPPFSQQSRQSPAGNAITVLLTAWHCLKTAWH